MYLDITMKCNIYNCLVPVTVEKYCEYSVTWVSRRFSCRGHTVRIMLLILYHSGKSWERANVNCHQQKLCCQLKLQFDVITLFTCTMENLQCDLMRKKKQNKILSQTYEIQLKLYFKGIHVATFWAFPQRDYLSSISVMKLFFSLCSKAQMNGPVNNWKDHRPHHHLVPQNSSLSPSSALVNSNRLEL